MHEESRYPENAMSRLRLLMLSRVGIVTFLLGIAAFVEVKGVGTLSSISASILFKTILATYVLTFGYLILLKYLQDLQWNIYVQSLCDVVLITAMVYGTGGIHSIYSVFYPLVIIYSVLFLGRRGGLIIASLAGISYGLFANLEFYGVIYPVYSSAILDFRLQAGTVFMRIIIHILSFYFIALLTSFVVEQEKRTRTLLAEKQSAFDQLNLLHLSIIESVDTGIMSINTEGRIKSFNRAASQITGFQFRDVENQLLTSVFPNFPLLPIVRESNARRPISATRFEIEFHAGSDRNLVLGGSLSPLRDPKGHRIGDIIIFQDLTEVNKMRESLEKSRRLAFIGGMAASLAHEIRNPLASISGSIQLLMKDSFQNKTNEKLMQIILRGKEQLENFLKDFLLIARPALGVREDIDLRESVHEVIDSLKCVPDWHENIITNILLPKTPIFIHANRTEIRQVLWNLILNAVQAMPDGGSLTIDADYLRETGVNGVEIKIRDTGYGIDNEDLQKIFEPFYTTREVGTGLGLVVVNRIMEGYNAKIDMQSDQGKGTTCTLWWPRQNTSQNGKVVES